MLIPPNGHSARIIRGFINVMLALFMKIRRNLGWKKNLTLIRTSDLFDEAWYLANNPDVARAKVDPARHYLLFGGFEGRDPSPEFSSALYLKIHANARKSGINPLVHFLKYGKQTEQTSDADGFDMQVVNFPKFNFLEGSAKFEPSRDTVL